MAATLCCGANAPQETSPAMQPVLRGDADLTAREAALVEHAKEDPSPVRYSELASFYWDVLVDRSGMPTAGKLKLIERALAAAELALASDRHFLAALTVKGQLKSAQADLETDPQRRIALLKEADSLQGVPPMSPAFESAFVRLQPHRIGGTLGTPHKVKDANPIYPPIAQSARVQGVVVCESIVDGTGHVAAVRALRSIPLLDAAALTAVRQWEFEPTLLDGQPVAVVMTVTVAFTLR